MRVLFYSACALAASLGSAVRLEDQHQHLFAQLEAFQAIVPTNTTAPTNSTSAPEEGQKLLLGGSAAAGGGTPGPAASPTANKAKTDAAPAKTKTAAAPVTTTAAPPAPKCDCSNEVQAAVDKEAAKCADAKKI